MPNRIIRESALTSTTLDSLSDGAERFFFRLTLVADDFGRFDADPRVLLAKCFPLKVTRLKLERITKWWLELIECGAVKAYRVDCRMYGYFPAWSKHQQVRAKTSKYPDPASANTCEQTPADSFGVVIGIGDGIGSDSMSGTPDHLNGNGHRPASSETREHAKHVLAFLNEKTGRTFRPVDTNLRLIEARLKTGATVQDCKSVIARKVRAWLPDPKMAPFLRPKTLFTPTNFENYLGELEPVDG